MKNGLTGRRLSHTARGAGLILVVAAATVIGKDAPHLYTHTIFSTESATQSPLERKMPNLHGLKPVPKASHSSIQNIHTYYYETFIGSLGMGFSRMPAPPTPTADKWLITGTANTTNELVRYSSESIQLVSLLEHDEPRVYTGASNRTTRTLTTFEVDALRELEAQPLASPLGPQRIIVSPDKTRMMGSIVSSSGCIKCHDGTLDGKPQLLGAFTYQITHKTFAKGKLLPKTPRVKQLHSVSNN